MKDNYAVRLLKRVKVLEDYIEHYTDRARAIAMKSHCCYEGMVELSTLMQMDAIGAVLSKREEVQEMLNKLVAAVNALDRVDRLILVLYYVKKLDVEDIVSYSGLALRTVYRRLGAARKKLAVEMAKLGCDDDWFAGKKKAILG
jgi:DNA-directed RNA polymerase specialized sigma24 family protein